MKIFSINDPEFFEYGNVLQGYDTKELKKAMLKIAMPENGTAYEPHIDSLEACGIYSSLRDRGFGGIPIQIGMCWGYNRKLNCLEYHKTSEINIGASDFILLLAKQQDIRKGVLTTDAVKAFFVPSGQAVEIYATSLHYAPCHADGENGFRVAIVLPKGTNTAKPDFKVQVEEDKWMTARNKWLLAHPDSSEAHQGAHVGLSGTNIDLG
jgi:hypothetical protein